MLVADVRNSRMSDIAIVTLKTHRGLAGPERQHVVTDEFLCMVSGCALQTDVCHCMFKTKVNMVQGQEDACLKPL